LLEISSTHGCLLPYHSDGVNEKTYKKREVQMQSQLLEALPQFLKKAGLDKITI